MNRIVQHANEVSDEAFGDIRRAAPVVNETDTPVTCLTNVAKVTAGIALGVITGGGKNGGH